MSSPSRLVKSLFWFTAFGGLGYVLLLTTTPSENEYKKLIDELPGADKKPKEVYSKNQKFMNVLQSASESNKPFYNLTKEEIEKSLKK